MWKRFHSLCLQLMNKQDRLEIFHLDKSISFSLNATFFLHLSLLDRWSAIKCYEQAPKLISSFLFSFSTMTRPGRKKRKTMRQRFDCSPRKSSSLERSLATEFEVDQASEQQQQTPNIGTESIAISKTRTQMMQIIVMLTPSPICTITTTTATIIWFILPGLTG